MYNDFNPENDVRNSMQIKIDNINSITNEFNEDMIIISDYIKKIESMMSHKFCFNSHVRLNDRITMSLEPSNDIPRFFIYFDDLTEMTWDKCDHETQIMIAMKIPELIQAIEWEAKKLKKLADDSKKAIAHLKSRFPDL